MLVGEKKKRYSTMGCRIALLYGNPKFRAQKQHLPSSIACLPVCVFKVSIVSTFIFSIHQHQAFLCFLWALIHSFLGKILLQVLIGKPVSRQFLLLVHKEHFSSGKLRCFVFSLMSACFCSEQLHDFAVNFTVRNLFVDHPPHLLVQGKGICSSRWCLASSMLLLALASW